MQKYQNKYRIKSTHLQNWDYGWKGIYFVTICTHNRKHYFGKITTQCRNTMHRVSTNNKMTNLIGAITTQCRNTMHRVSTNNKMTNLI